MPFMALYSSSLSGLKPSPPKFVCACIIGVDEFLKGEQGMKMGFRMIVLDRHALCFGRAISTACLCAKPAQFRRVFNNLAAIRQCLLWRLRAELSGPPLYYGSDHFWPPGWKGTGGPGSFVEIHFREQIGVLIQPLSFSWMSVRVSNCLCLKSTNLRIFGCPSR